MDVLKKNGLLFVIGIWMIFLSNSQVFFAQPVSNGSNAELQQKIEECLKDISAKEREEAKSLLEKLISKDDKIRCEALDELLKIVPADSLKELLSLPPGKLEIKRVNAVQKIYHPGDKIDFKVKITNIDTKSFWVCKSKSNYWFPLFSPDKQMGFDVYGAIFSYRVRLGLGARLIAPEEKTLLPNPLKDFILLAPGESITYSFESYSIGAEQLLSKIFFTFSYAGGKLLDQDKIRKVLDDHPDNKKYFEVYNLLRPYQGKVFSEKKTEMLVIPEEISADKIQPEDGLQISLETTQKTFKQSEDIAFDVTFHNKNKEVLTLVNDKESGYPIWILIKDKKGEVVKMGAIKDGTLIDTLIISPRNLKEVKIAGGETHSVNLTFKNTLAEGEYSLTVGYRVSGTKILKKVKAWSGGVVSNSVSFKVAK